MPAQKLLLAFAVFVALFACSAAAETTSLEVRVVNVPVMHEKLDTLLVKLKGIKGECKLDEEDRKFVAQSREDLVFQNSQDLSTASIKAEMETILPHVKIANTVGQELDLVGTALTTRKAARVEAQKVVVMCEAEIARILAEVCCPNDCTGHGKCDFQNGQCTCDFGYQDLDCGTLCPTTTKGICNLGGTCSAGICSCERGFAGDKCEKECPKQCSASGTCELCGDSAKCLCDVGFAGNDCAASAPGFWKNTDGVALECPAGYASPCSGHGDCAPTDGKCHCNPKYEGSACENQKTEASAPAMESYYFQPALGNCKQSGGGDAIMAEEETGTTTLSVKNAFWECELDEGLHMPFRVLEVENGGEACEVTISVYATHQDAPVFESKRSFGASLGLFSLHGKMGHKIRITRSGFGKLSLKQLKLYTDNTAGDEKAANTCCHGFFEEAGECKECPGGSTNPCNHKGECSAQVGFQMDTAVCACHYGFVGGECQYECPVIAGAVCGNFGKCIAQDGAAQCICTENGHTGEFCDQCGRGYSKQEDGSCKPCPGGASAFAPGGAGQICNNQGQCGADGLCVCEEGFEGEACETRVSTLVTYSTSACGGTCPDGDVSLTQNVCSQGSSGRGRRSATETKFATRCQNTKEVREPNVCNLADCVVSGCTTRPSCAEGHYQAALAPCHDSNILGFHNMVKVTCCPMVRTCLSA